MSKEKPLFLLNLNDLKQLFHENGYSRAKVDLNLERGGFVSEIYDEIMFS